MDLGDDIFGNITYSNASVESIDDGLKWNAPGLVVNTPGDLAVQIEMSAVIHWLRVSSPDYQKFRRILEDAKDRSLRICLTEHPNTHEILDVALF